MRVVDRIVHTITGHRIEVAHGNDCVALLGERGWGHVLTAEQAHRLATALHVQADHADEVASDD